MTSVARFGLSIFLLLLAGSTLLSIQPNVASAQEASSSTDSTESIAVPNSANPCDDAPSTINKANCTLSQRIAEPTGYVYIAWQTMRSVINIILILALLVISFSNILRISIDTYAVKKALPNLVIGVILANASFLIIRYMADIATVAVYFFVDRTAVTGTEATFSTFISGIVAKIATDSLETVGVAVTNPIVLPIAILIVTIIVVVGLLWLAFILYFRLVAIYLLTILAPLAFVAYGLPGFEKYFKQWWQQFIKWLFILPAMCALFWVMYVVGGGGTASADNNSIARTITQFFIFFTALSLPSKMGGAVVDKASKAFHKYSGSQAAQQWAGDTSKDVGRGIGSKVANRTGILRLQEWNKLRKENFENQLKNRREDAGTRARRGKVGRDTYRLKHEATAIGNDRASTDAKNDREALTDELAERLNSSEFTKNTAEKLKDINLQTKKIEYYVKARAKDAGGNLLNPKINTVIESFAEASSKAAALTDAVGTQEKIAVGGYTNKRLDALAAAKEHADLSKEIDGSYKATEEAERLHGTGSTQHISAQANHQAVLARNNPLLARAKTKFDTIKAKHKDLANLDIDEVTRNLNDKNSSQGVIWEEERKKQVKSYNGGIDAITEDARKNGSVHLLTTEKDNQGFVDGNHANIAELAGNNTINVDMEEQNKFQLYTYTLKDWMKSDRNPNYRDAIATSLATFVKHGGQTVNSGKLGGITAANVDQIVADINNGKYNPEELKGIVAGLNRLDAFGGDPGRHINHVAR